MRALAVVISEFSVCVTFHQPKEFVELLGQCEPLRPPTARTPE
jgi:hypothetical protein